MPRKDVLNQEYRLGVGLRAHQFGKIQFCTEEIPDGPQPLLERKIPRVKARESCGQPTSTQKTRKPSRGKWNAYRPLVVIEAFRQVVVVVVQGVVINPAVHHVAGTERTPR